MLWFCITYDSFAPVLYLDDIFLSNRVAQFENISYKMCVYFYKYVDNKDYMFIMRRRVELKKKTQLH